MTNTATQRPATRQTVTAGQVVIGPDRHHADGTGRRPWLVLQVSGDQAYVAELTHSPQGAWVTDELPTAAHDHSYLALVDWRTGEWMPRWVPTATLDRYRRQLSRRSREAALDAAAQAYARRR